MYAPDPENPEGRPLTRAETGQAPKSAGPYGASTAAGSAWPYGHPGPRRDDDGYASRADIPLPHEVSAGWCSIPDCTVPTISPDKVCEAHQ